MFSSFFRNYSLIFKIFLVILILLGITFLLIWVYPNYIKKEKAEFSQNLQTIRQDYLSGNDDMGEFLSNLGELNKKSLNRSQEDQNLMNLLIGEATLHISPSEGVISIKKIAEDKNYSNDQRGYALAILANYYDFYPDNNFALKEIFSGDFLNQFIKENPGDIRMGFKNLNEYIDKTSSPAIITKCRLGLWRSEELLNNPNLTEEEKTAHLTLAKEYFQKADFLISQDLTLPEFYKKLALRLKAQTFQNLYLAKKEEVSLNKVETLYLQATSSEKDQETNRNLEKTTAYARFYYAAFLAKAVGESANEKIKDVLTPLYDVTIRNYPIFKFLKLAKDDDNSPWHDDINVLSSIDTRFKSLTDQL